MIVCFACVWVECNDHAVEYRFVLFRLSKHTGEVFVEFKKLRQTLKNVKIFIST